MSSRRIAAIVVLTALGAILAVCGSLGMLKHHTTTREIAVLLREKLPLGSSDHRVTEVLDSLKVEHGPFDTDGNVVRAVWRRTSVGLITETAIVGRFFFSDERRLVRYELEEVTIGT